ncbi:metal dependent phosphohydrolase [Candidatus Magnetomorum sp. HK-1]|nr:metal dependent phosphohydrolase [Candidatus Magnetomorum sp. HK-1]
MIDQKNNDFSGKVLWDSEAVSLAKDKALNNLLKDVLIKIKTYGEAHVENINKLIQIGLALSLEKDINALLEKIVDEARVLTNADAGTLYICDEPRKNLNFTILQNDTMNTRLGGTSGKAINLPSVPLYIGIKPNYANVSSHVALTGETVNISDVYEAKDFDFTGPREYDKTTGYRSKSMLVHPLINHENDVIGVLQLLNAQDPTTGEIIPFAKEYNLLIGALASQAAVALNNAQLIKSLKELLYSFIEIIAKAIDEKSPYTGGHIKLVVQLSMMIAEKINEMDTGPFKDQTFNEEELEELRLAAWMHDVGKITTPEYVVDKSTKLETIFDRIFLVEHRFQLIEQLIINKYEKKICHARMTNISPEEIQDIINERDREVNIVKDDFKFITECSETAEFMETEKIDRVKAISKKTYVYDEKITPYLTPDETENLCIIRGNLTDQERKIIENHSIMTYKMLEPLPFPKHLLNVPKYASGHHEKVNGSGYPLGEISPELSYQARIMAVADIFEALTAQDRPYRGPMKLSKAIDILRSMKDNGHIDPDIFELFISSGIYLEYAHKVLNPEQIDID